MSLIQAMIYHRNNGDYEWWVCTESNAVMSLFKVPCKPQVFLAVPFRHHQTLVNSPFLSVVAFHPL